ncbi:hypothetical protein KEM55_008791 [Ascosphaera atra]|nr:hypothetical protein KEM55_008791 [Ascosphaera atra]
MGRSRHFDEQSGSGRAKRRKIDDGNNTESTQQQQHVEIKSHRQLRDLLSYQQGAQEVRQGVRIFKDFLASIGDTRDVSPAATATTNRETNLRILKSYCDHQTIKPTDETEHSPPACFPDLLATWTYADSNNDGTLLTLLPSILASFLKTVSPYPDFHPFCTSLCKHLLQRDQLRLINRAFQAPKAKEHLISPCLRLLTEMVSFDSGAVAGLVFARREVTFKRLETFLVTGKNASESAGKRLLYL